MSLKLSEWNEVCKYAEKVCKDLSDKGYRVEAKPYIVYNNDSKGICLFVLDDYGNIFSSYYTGFHYSLSEITKAIDEQAIRIMNEC